MVNLTLTRANRDGSPYYPPASVTVAGTVVYGKGFYLRRVGQSTRRTMDGELHTYDRGVTIVEGELTVKALSPEDKVALENFIVEDLNFNEGFFNLSCDHTSVDFGEGGGVTVKACKFEGDLADLKGFFEHVPPGIFHLVMPYTYNKSKQV